MNFFTFSIVGIFVSVGAMALLGPDVDEDIAGALGSASFCAYLYVMHHLNLLD